MAQMAPALTEATASPESSRKNSVDRHCTSTVEEDFKQENNGLGLDLKLVSHNGLVRLINDNNIADIANTIKPSEQNTPILPKRIEEIKGKTEMPNGHYGIDAEKTEAAKSSFLAAKEEKRNASLDLSRTCASTAKSSAGNCNTGCVNEERNRVSHHPVASLNSSKLLMPLKTTQALRRQGKLESRVKEVETRLRKLQARQLSHHVLHQLGSLVEKHSEYCNSPSSALRIGENSGIGVISESKTNADNSLELRRDQSHNTTMPGSFVSTVKGNLSSFGSVLKELEHVSSESSNMDERNVFDDFKLQLDVVNSVESWSSQLELLESIDDSDATEGSSGEESEDEGDARKSKLRSKRAQMLRQQYKMEEGEVASHWSWLQSQIINLERQIRRYDDLYRGGRLRKGPVRLQACAARANSQTSGADGIFESGIAKDLKNSPVFAPSPLQSKDDSENISNSSLKEADNHLWNGMKRTLLDKSLLGDEDQPLKRYRNALMKNDLTDGRCSRSLPASTNDLYFQSARTRGVCTVKKRRVVRLSQIRHGPKQTAVCCMCVTPVTPCLMCSKSPKALPVVSPKQTMAEKVALLDQSFHPVLSFCADIPLQLHFGALLKRGGFEKRTKPQALRNITQTNTIEKTKPSVVAKTGGRRSQLAKGAAASLLSSAKLHNQKHDRKRGYSVPSTPRNTIRGSDSRVCQTDGPRKKRAAAISAAAQLQKRARSLSLPTVRSSSPTPTSTPSPTPTFSQSLPPSSLTTLMKKKKGSNAFDINNIVIPYSMASSTRVEKLQYKEIPTPSWRINDLGQDEMASSEDDKSEMKEDMSDELYISRHAFCEEHERKRFLGLVKKKRKRATRQSSEMSLPDPSSPVGYTDSQGGTPPGTPTCYAPSPVNVNNSQSMSVASLPITALATQPLVSATNSTMGVGTASFSERLHRSLSDSTVVHRRSSSTDRSEKSVTEYEEIWPPVSPWPSRTFPLSDSDITSLKLPTPLPTPSSSMPASPVASSPGSPVCSPLASPASDASSEKNEWTVKLVSDQGPTATDDTGGPPRKGIVLKLAKR